MVGWRHRVQDRRRHRVPGWCLAGGWHRARSCGFCGIPEPGQGPPMPPPRPPPEPQNDGHKTNQKKLGQTQNNDFFELFFGLRWGRKHTQMSHQQPEIFQTTFKQGHVLQLQLAPAKEGAKTKENKATCEKKTVLPSLRMIHLKCSGQPTGKPQNRRQN